LANQSIFFNSSTGKYSFAFNSRLLPQKITLIGQLKGETTFEGDFDNPIYDPNVNFWIVLAAIGLYVLDHADYKYTSTTGPEGTTTSHEVSWNGMVAGGGGDGTFETFDGQTFKADRIFIRSNYFTPSKPSELQLTMQEVQIMGKDIRSLTITDENTKG